MKLHIAAATAVAAALLALPGAASADHSEKTKLTFFMWAGANQGVVPTEVIEAYKEKHPKVTFTKYSITNQFFNEESQYQAKINKVTLVEQDGLQELLKIHPVRTFELDQYVLN